jgi:hypothetical protein
MSAVGIGFQSITILPTLWPGVPLSNGSVDKGPSADPFYRDDERQRSRAARTAIPERYVGSILAVRTTRTRASLMAGAKLEETRWPGIYRRGHRWV